MTDSGDLLQADMPQVRVGNIANVDPANFENTLPFIRGPDSAASCVVNLFPW